MLELTTAEVKIIMIGETGSIGEDSLP